jgi:phage terminase large subunit-like protein
MLEKYKGRICFAGLDLSSSRDITAFVLVFPPTGKEEKYTVLCRLFIPNDTVKDKVLMDGVPYDTWIKAGHMLVTPGNVIDYEWIFDDMQYMASLFDIREVAFDRWGMDWIKQDLDTKYTLVEFPQSINYMSPPTKYLEELVMKHKIQFNNPVLDWTASNCRGFYNNTGMVKLTKGEGDAPMRIDPVIALVMALARATTASDNPYQDRGLVSVTF